jgi:hypothetical protein
VWRTRRRTALDEVAAAHAAIGGTGRGRRFATQQVNHAYAVLLSAQFQGFCRDLHRDAVDHLIVGLPPPTDRLLKAELLRDRKLQHGNPNPGNLGADLNRLGFDLWPAVLSGEPRAAGWRTRLEQLNAWRNAIAHQDFDPAPLEPVMHLSQGRAISWGDERDTEAVPG